MNRLDDFYSATKHLIKADNGNPFSLEKVKNCSHYIDFGDHFNFLH